VLELPENKLWAIEIKRGSAPNVMKGFFLALEHLQPDRAFIVYSGTDRYPKSKNVEAIGLAALCQELAALS
jgi:hypothetical protein